MDISNLDICQSVWLPAVVKVGVVALLVGGLVLIVSVVRARFFLHRRDPYSREVIR